MSKPVFTNSLVVTATALNDLSEPSVGMTPAPHLTDTGGTQGTSLCPSLTCTTFDLINVVTH